MKRLLLVTLALVGCAQPGVPGSQGPKGDTGQAGAEGLTRASEGSVVPVKFCPGVTSYPSTFPEYGLCINNQIYAVYSANDGFLTLIPKGSYNSNAIGSNCNFQVLDNCVIKN